MSIFREDSVGSLVGTSRHKSRGTMFRIFLLVTWETQSIRVQAQQCMYVIYHFQDDPVLHAGCGAVSPGSHFWVWPSLEGDHGTSLEQLHALLVEGALLGCSFHNNRKLPLGGHLLLYKVAQLNELKV